MPSHGGPLDDGRGSPSPGRESEAGTVDPPSGCGQSSAVGREGPLGWQAQREELCHGVGAGQEVCGVDQDEHQLEGSQHVELPGICEDQAAVRERDVDQPVADSFSLVSGDLGAGGHPRGISSVIGQPPQYATSGPTRNDGTSEAVFATDGNREDARGAGRRAEVGEADSHRVAQGGDCPPFRGHRQMRLNTETSEVPDERSIPGASAILLEDVSRQIEDTIISVETALGQMETALKGVDESSRESFFRVDVLEVYCEPLSQITHQARALGLRAERFTREDGDLSTTVGQKCLLEMVDQLRPREIWVAPECRYWGNFSRLNSSRSPELAAKIADGRDKQRTHLRLCNTLFLHQMAVGGHFHLERPIRIPADFRESLRHAFHAKNSLSRVKGYSPEQAVLGIAPRLPGSVISAPGLASHGLAEGLGPAADAFRDNLARRAQARKAFIDADNSSSLRRALLRRTRPMRGPYESGDWVLYWKRVGANLRRARGSWHGPARVLAVEGTRVVWLSHAGRLVRASPEQLRAASLREWRLVRRAEEGGAGTAPTVWTRQLKSSAYLDLESDSQEPEAVPPLETQMSDYSPSVLEPEGEMSEVPDGEPVSQIPSQSHSESPHATTESPPAHEVPIPESEGEEDLLLFGDDVDPECALPETRTFQFWEADVHPENEMYAHLGNDVVETVLIASDARKRKVEVKLSELSSEDQLRMAAAKHKEVGAWLTHKIVKRVTKGRIPDHCIMRCRWILSWKPANGHEAPGEAPDGFKAKARMVVIGFEDPDLGKISSDSPTLTKDGRQLVVQTVASNRWELISFDVSTAFLHGEGDGRLLDLYPPPELAEGLGMGPTDQCQLVGGAYGRVDAPALWFKKFRDSMVEAGFKQCPLDPCVFAIYSGKGSTVKCHGVLGIHVDDGIGGGDPTFHAAVDKLRTKFKFGSFDRKEFDFTGIHYKQLPDGSIEYDQIRYIEKITPVSIPKERRATPEAKLDAREVSQLCSIVGALQYAAVHTRPDICARVGELQSACARAVVEDLISANKVLFDAKTMQSHESDAPSDCSGHADLLRLFGRIVPFRKAGQGPPRCAHFCNDSGALGEQAGSCMPSGMD